MKKYFTLNNLMNICLMFFTGLGFLLTALKLPQYGLISSLVGQFFWLYSGYKAWKQADQFGIFVNAVMITLIVSWGVVNYWLLS